MHLLLAITVEDTRNLHIMAIGALTGAYQFQKATRFQGTKGLLVNLTIAAVWLISLFPFSLAALYKLLDIYYSNYFVR